MPIIKLTDNHYIDTDVIAEIRLTTRYGGPYLEIRHRDPGRATILRGYEALAGMQVFKKWQASEDALKGKTETNAADAAENPS